MEDSPSNIKLWEFYLVFQQHSECFRITDQWFIRTETEQEIVYKERNRRGNNLSGRKNTTQFNKKKKKEMIYPEKRIGQNL